MADIQDSSQIVNMVSPLALAASANVQTGVLLLCKEALVTAIQDSRLSRQHLRVLACLVNFINTRNAKAWPDRKMIASALDLEAHTVSNRLRELRDWGYLIAERERVPEANNRSLMVYTFGNIDHETIRREIQAYVDRIKGPTGWDSQKSLQEGTVPRGGDSEAAKVPTGRDYDLAKVPKNGTRKSLPVGHSNSKKELNEESKLVIAAPSAQPQSRGTRLPSDWQLPRQWGEWTLSQFPKLGAAQVRDEGHRFHDYWVAKSGKDATKLDWFATWRNWCRNAKWPAAKEGELERLRRLMAPAFEREVPATQAKRLTHER